MLACDCWVNAVIGVVVVVGIGAGFMYWRARRKASERPSDQA
jgi:uncharacterized protein with FMN-binding domain